MVAQIAYNVLRLAVDAGVFLFQLNDKTPYGMEYLSKLDNAISNAVYYYNETYNKQNK